LWKAAQCLPFFLVVAGNVTNETVGVEVVVGAGISATRNKYISAALFNYNKKTQDTGCRMYLHIKAQNT
jgi:hypothetical protein